MAHFIAVNEKFRPTAYINVDQICSMYYEPESNTTSLQYHGSRYIDIDGDLTQVILDAANKKNNDIVTKDFLRRELKDYLRPIGDAISAIYRKCGR